MKKTTFNFPVKLSLFFEILFQQDRALHLLQKINGCFEGNVYLSCHLFVRLFTGAWLSG